MRRVGAPMKPEMPNRTSVADDDVEAELDVVASKSLSRGKSSESATARVSDKIELDECSDRGNSSTASSSPPLSSCPPPSSSSSSSFASSLAASASPASGLGGAFQAVTPCRDHGESFRNGSMTLASSPKGSGQSSSRGDATSLANGATEARPNAASGARSGTLSVVGT